MPERTELIYKRSRFGTRLPLDRLYSQSHYWLRETQPGLWRAGFTRFATRMLGDVVEYQFDVGAGAAVNVGQKIGWIEGFKAISDIYAVADGDFAALNPALLDDITLIESDPYERGWLYEVRGTPEPGAFDAARYAAVLDATIDKMLAGRHEEGEDD